MGLCNRPLNLLALHMGIRPGIGTAFNVNILMPLFAIAAAYFYPRIWTVGLGALVATVGFYLGLLFVQSPNLTTWSAGSCLRGVDPILLPACLGYGVLGSLAAVTVHPWRTVGLADAHLRCTACGYLLVELREPRCPECGTAFDAKRTLDRTSPRQAQIGSIEPGAGGGGQR